MSFPPPDDMNGGFVTLLDGNGFIRQIPYNSRIKAYLQANTDAFMAADLRANPLDMGPIMLTGASGASSGYSHGPGALLTPPSPPPYRQSSSSSSSFHEQQPPAASSFGSGEWGGRANASGHAGLHTFQQVGTHGFDAASSSGHDWSSGPATPTNCNRQAGNTPAQFGAAAYDYGQFVNVGYSGAATSRGQYNNMNMNMDTGHIHGPGFNNHGEEHYAPRQATQAAPSADLYSNMNISSNAPVADTVQTGSVAGTSLSPNSTALSEAEETTESQSATSHLTPRFLPPTCSIGIAWDIAQKHPDINARLDQEASAIATTALNVLGIEITLDFVKMAVLAMHEPTRTPVVEGAAEEPTVVEESTEETWVCSYPHACQSRGYYECGKTYTKKSARDRHVASKHLLVGYIGCNGCNKAFARGDEVDRHQKEALPLSKCAAEQQAPSPAPIAGPSTGQTPQTPVTGRVYKKRASKAAKKNSDAAAVEAGKHGHPKRRDGHRGQGGKGGKGSKMGKTLA